MCRLINRREATNATNSGDRDSEEVSLKSFEEGVDLFNQQLEEEQRLESREG